MPFTHGKHTVVYAGGYDLTGYLRSLSSSGSADVAETSVFGLSDKTYIPGTKDATLSFDGLYDGDVEAVDEALSEALGGSEVAWLWYHGVETIGSYGYGGKGVETSYEVSADIGDVVQVSGGTQLSGGRKRVQCLHAKGEETATGGAPSVDNGADTTNGGGAILQSFAGDGTIKVQHSVDNIAWVDLITFDPVSSDHVGQVKEVGGTVHRYVRAHHTPGVSITYALGFWRN